MFLSLQMRYTAAGNGNFIILHLKLSHFGQTNPANQQESQRIDACDFPSLCNMKDRFQPGSVTSTQFTKEKSSLIDPLNMSIFAFRRMIVAPGFIKSTGR
ncbi:hypothetical protein RHMOL_Rhmol02G0231400 [Rhododendron molle]|uniref:Uncharacterized protein n=1 Tax=Rhododendron molle TaxID=49168 RepID=A0ACC0PUV3_RHOML|nr:hypothetical protein RHMOL_Rhmol02G0231400 [Rhododendron molle]